MIENVLFMLWNIKQTLLHVAHWSKSVPLPCLCFCSSALELLVQSTWSRAHVPHHQQHQHNPLLLLLLWRPRHPRHPLFLQICGKIHAAAHDAQWSTTCVNVYLTFGRRFHDTGHFHFKYFKSNIKQLLPHLQPRGWYVILFIFFYVYQEINLNIDVALIGCSLCVINKKGSGLTQVKGAKEICYEVKCPSLATATCKIAWTPTHHHWSTSTSHRLIKFSVGAVLVWFSSY